MLMSFLIALSLNFDTLSVAIVEGAQNKKTNIKKTLIVAFFFGMGQATMAQIGAILGLSFKIIIGNIDHWIAFFLLLIIGLKMINEKETCTPKKEKGYKLNYWTLLCLVVATSIDALIVGISLAFIKRSIIFDVLMIAIVSFTISFLGYHLGEKVGAIFKSNLKYIGGLILILIGIKVLLEHLFF